MDTIFEGDQHPFTSANSIGIHSSVCTGFWHVLTHIQIAMVYAMVYLSGWWFQTFFMFHFIYGMSSFPIDELHHFSRWLKPPTSFTFTFYFLHFWLRSWLLVIFTFGMTINVSCQLSLATKAAGASSHEALVSGGAVECGCHDAMPMLWALNGHKKQEPNSG